MTELQLQIFGVLMESKVPALAAWEIAKVMKVAPCRLGGPLGSMRSKYNLGCVNMPRSDKRMILVPGRVVGAYNQGLIEVPERKRHYFLKERMEEVAKLKKERYDDQRESNRSHHRSAKRHGGS